MHTRHGSEYAVGAASRRRRLLVGPLMCVACIGLVACEPDPVLTFAEPTRLLAPDEQASKENDSSANPTGSAAAIWSREESEEGEGFDTWNGGESVDGLAVTGGALTGTTTDDFSFVYSRNLQTAEAEDLLYGVEVRLSVSHGSRVSVVFQTNEEPDLTKVRRDVDRSVTAELISDGAMHTYRVRAPYTPKLSELRHVFLVPSDEPGASFSIDSVRLIGLQDHLEANGTLVAWQGLSGVYMDALTVRAPHTERYRVALPEEPWLDLNLGTLSQAPVTYRVEYGPQESDVRQVFEATVTEADRWVPTRIDLEGLGGREISLELSVDSSDTTATAFWGQPVIRGKKQAESPDPNDAPTPQGVIVIMADTLRKDHLDAYGYERRTAPHVTRLSVEGVLFEDCVAQAPWTLVSTASIFTAMYPYTHTVRYFDSRLSDDARTLAEHYRDAGFATLSLSSVVFTGQQANLHQGFEAVHESRSLENPANSKTARVFVPRLLPWLEAHRDTRFFVFLHVFDPHNPFRPHFPYDRMWADPDAEAAHAERVAALQDVIEDPALNALVMPSREDFERAKVDPAPYFEHVKGYYDGSIRGMNDEIKKLLDELDRLGLMDKTLIAFVSDHGEEFLEHGRSFHGQSVYGELANVPLILWQPEVLPQGRRVAETVETIDLMPTLLELSGLEIPDEAQGMSLLPLIQDAGTAEWTKAAYSEKSLTKEHGFAHGDGAADAIILDGWKLIHNIVPREGVPEFELFRRAEDPLDGTNLATENPEVVARLRAALDEWRAGAEAVALPSDSRSDTAMSEEDVERLRSMGYLH